MKNLFGQVIKVIEPIEEPSKVVGPKLFDWLKAINQSKEDLRSKDPSLGSFEPFIINKGLGQAQGTIGLANMVNRMPRLSKECVHLFYLHGMPKNRIYSKWSKLSHGKDLKPFQEATGLGRNKALEALRVLTKEQIKRIIKPIGGKIKN